MANILDTIVGYINPEAGLNRELHRASLANLRNHTKMDYDAAGKGRRGFKVSRDNSSRTIEKNKMLILRRNMRDMERNNTVISSAVKAKVRHTIGPGIKPSLRTDAKSKSKKSKAKLAQITLNKWMNSVNCDLYGKNNFFGLQRLGYKTAVSSGEYLIIRQRTIEPVSGLPLQIKILEGDYLDHTKTGRNETTGNDIVMGVELNSDELPVAYWIFDSHPGDQGFISRSRLTSSRHSAENVLHFFKSERPGQIRGLPEGLASATKAKNLDEFQDARLEQMKVAACLVGTVSKKTTGPGGGKGGDETPLPRRISPGVIIPLRHNEEMNFNQPPSVAGQHDFVSEELHFIASDYGITYQALTGDLKQVNFTSGRMGYLDMYAGIKMDRDLFIIPQTLNPVWAWLQEAFEFIGLSVRDLTCEWIPPRREMFDPTKEIPPLIKAIRSGLKPMQRALQEQGDDPDVIMTQYQEWNDQLDARNLVFDTDPRSMSGAGNVNPNTTPEDKNAEEK